MNKGYVVVACIAAVLVLSTSRVPAAESPAPLFTDDDLKRYERSSAPDGTLAPKETAKPPETPRIAKSKDTIYREHDRSVAAVVAYDEKGQAFSHGSGFVFTPDGAIITSYHVISNASSAKVKINGVVFPVEGVLYADKEHDVVLLKVEAKGLHAMKPGDSRQVRPGEMAYLMDNLQGKGSSITEGTVIGLRDVGGKKMIQLSIPFSAGSSGGPVFNPYGEVIGVAAMVVNDGKPVSFAVPVYVIKERFTAGSVIPLKEALYRDQRQAADYWIAVAARHNNDGRPQEAIDAYKKAIDADPDSSMAYNGLGVVYAGLKRYKDAVDAYQRAIKLEPDSAWTRSNLGLAYIKMGMFREAVEALQQAIKIMHDLSSAHFNLGIAYTQLGQYREAVSAYKEAVWLAPDLADAHYGLGLVYLHLHDRQSARQQYDILKRLDPAQAANLWQRIKE